MNFAASNLGKLRNLSPNTQERRKNLYKIRRCLKSCRKWSKCNDMDRRGVSAPRRSKRISELFFSCNKWSTYTEIDLRWELRNYRKRFERLSRIQDDFLKELLDSNYTARYSSEQMIVADAFNTLYSLKRNQKILLFTTIVFLATTIIALMV